jgi:MFS transporter, DHA1 family, staphyloferrin A biosynthesis exporter
MKTSTFSPLRHRNYRLFWFGNLISQTGDWLDQVALNWLVVSTTDSPIWLGLVNLGRGLPIILFALVGGVFADRLNRRTLLMMTQASAMVVAIVLGICVFWSAPIWVIVVLATCRGLVVAFNLPVRHSLVSELVPRSEIASAIALNTITANTAKIVGPLLSSLIIATLGIVACFAVNAVTFLAVLVMLFLMDIPESRKYVASTESFASSFSGGVDYLRGERIILLLVMVAFIPTFLCQPFVQILALFAENVFGVGATGLAIMVALAAVGAIFGGFFSAHLQRSSRSGATMLVFMACFGISLILFSLMPSFLFALPFVFCAGAMQIAFNSSNNVLIQMAVADGYRGRVLSMLFMSRGLVSLGVAFMAFLAAFTGAQIALGSMAATAVGIAVILLFVAPKLRKLRV